MPLVRDPLTAHAVLVAGWFLPDLAISQGGSRCPGRTHPMRKVFARVSSAQPTDSFCICAITAPVDLSPDPGCLSAGNTRARPMISTISARALSSAETPRRVLALDYRGRGLSQHDRNWRNYDIGIEMDRLPSPRLTAMGVHQAIFVGTSRGRARHHGDRGGASDGDPCGGVQRYRPRDRAEGIDAHTRLMSENCPRRAISPRPWKSCRRFPTSNSPVSTMKAG